MRPERRLSNTSSVAVCYSGWLAVRVPKRGAGARRHLLDVLAADAFVAGTYLPPEMAACGGQTKCLLRRLDGLRPITRARVDPMLSVEDLRRLVTVSPNWPAVSKHFDHRRTLNGISIWAPLLGDGNLSVLRELNDYSRVFRLVEEYERARGLPYERVVFSRLEFDWLAPHPPLDLLEPEAVWLPSGGVSGGVNDRHAVVSRSAAPTYFKRWQLLLSPHLFRRLPRRVILREGPEELLKSVLSGAKLRVRYFPSTMVLGCCSATARKARRCFGAHVCVVRRREEADHDDPRAAPRRRFASRAVSAKYFDELKFAERHAAALACPGARFASAGGDAPEVQAGRSAFPREAGVFIDLPMPRLSKWHPDPRVHAEGGVVLGSTPPVFTTFVRTRPVITARSVENGSSADGGGSRMRSVGRRRSLERGDDAARALLGKTLRGLQLGLQLSTGLTIAASSTSSSRLGRGGATGGGTQGGAQKRWASVLAESLWQCPIMPRHWWPVGAVGGYCSATQTEGNCTTGDKGSFKEFEKRGLHRGEPLSIGHCARMCSRCARCNYISVGLSPDVTDCSWYHSCDLRKTRTLVDTNFVSMSLRSAQRFDRMCRKRYHESAC
jgi:hypothetical protein